MRLVSTRGLNYIVRFASNGYFRDAGLFEKRTLRTTEETQARHVSCINQEKQQALPLLLKVRLTLIRRAHLAPLRYCGEVSNRSRRVCICDCRTVQGDLVRA